MVAPHSKPPKGDWDLLLAQRSRQAATTLAAKLAVAPLAATNLINLAARAPAATTAAMPRMLTILVIPPLLLIIIINIIIL